MKKYLKFGACFITGIYLILLILLPQLRYNIIALFIFGLLLIYTSNGVQGVQTRLKRKDRFESK